MFSTKLISNFFFFFFFFFVPVLFSEASRQIKRQAKLLFFPSLFFFFFFLSGSNRLRIEKLVLEKLRLKFNNVHYIYLLEMKPFCAIARSRIKGDQKS